MIQIFVNILLHQEIEALLIEVTGDCPFSELGALGALRKKILG